MGAKEQIVVVGAGGHATVIADIIQTSTPYELLGFLDPSPRAGNKKILGGDEYIESMDPATSIVLALGFQLMGARLSLMARIDQRGLHLPVLAHQSGVVASSVEIGGGTVVMAGAVLNPEVRVGRHCCINTGATVDHDCELGNNVFVLPGATLAGTVRVGDNTVIGMGAKVREGVTIGANCVVGAMSFVNRDVPDQAMVHGIPAKLVSEAAW